MAQYSLILKQILPRRLIALRQQRALSQRAIAAQAGVAVSTINEIESGLVADLRLSTVWKIAGALQVAPEQLLCWSGAPGCEEDLQALSRAVGHSMARDARIA